MSGLPDGCVQLKGEGRERYIGLSIEAARSPGFKIAVGRLVSYENDFHAFSTHLSLGPFHFGGPHRAKVKTQGAE